MLDTLRTAWKIKDLRQRILFTLGVLVVFRIGSFIPIPGVNPAKIQDLFQGENLFGLMNVITGDALSRFSIFAVGIFPYINASIIMNLLTLVIPKLEQLAKEGEEGRKKINQYTRYGTVILTLVQATSMTFIPLIRQAIISPGIFANITIIVSLTAGTCFLMWLGELTTERGIGNGISLIIFAGIVAGFPSAAAVLYETVRLGEASIFMALLVVLILLGLIVCIIGLEEGQRRIPVQYAKRVVGRKMYGGQSTHIPLKVNQAGVIPVIFASALLMVPITIAQFVNVPIINRIGSALDFGKPLNTVLYFILIFFFTFFYTAVQFDPMKVATDMKKYGGFIPGLRPGRPTAEYLSKVSTRLTFAGGLSLAIISVLPIIFQNATRVNMMFTGTGVIIIVGVALETMKQLETHMMMRNYQGFLK
ncbi:MAG TPA: preprotein translocase subunit SecY [Firmicutes bacterium]|nr:preprotein translocase subunit SecY [Bacillota bacterium]